MPMYKRPWHLPYTDRIFFVGKQQRLKHQAVIRRVKPLPFCSLSSSHFYLRSGVSLLQNSARGINLNKCHTRVSFGHAHWLLIMNEWICGSAEEFSSNVQ